MRTAVNGAVLLLLAAVAGVLPASTVADQATQPTASAAGRIATGKYHTCAVLDDGGVRCWGYGASGQLGYGDTKSIGARQTPASVAAVSLGAGRTAKAISAGDVHSCALLDDGSVRCWGYGSNGRLGYGNTKSIGASQTPGSVAAVDLGAGRTAKAITAGGAHSCALLDDGSVRCWGFGFDGRLGYGNKNSVGDVQTPGSVGPVDLGPGHTAKAISAGGQHTCALLDDGSVRCWGFGANGQLGYGNAANVGDQQTPGSVGPVDLGEGRTAISISAGGAHTCAVLDNGAVRCWGDGASGQLGSGNTSNVGEVQTPGKVAAVALGAGRSAKAISAGGAHTCALLDDSSVRCWGYGAFGQLGYGNSNNVGDTPASTPEKVGPVDLGRGRTAIAVSAGGLHSCALLDNGRVRCWGDGANGRLGYCNEANVGATPATTPGTAGPVNLLPGDGGALCASTRGGGVDPVHLQAQRAQALRGCLRAATARARAQRSARRRNCLKRYGRTPGPVTGLHRRALSSSSVSLTFLAPGSDGKHPPAARAYLIKQSRRPIRNARAFQRAKALCSGSCRFNVTIVGTRIKLTITRLAPHTTYYYAIAARDNVSGRLGPRSQMVPARTR